MDWIKVRSDEEDAFAMRRSDRPDNISPEDWEAFLSWVSTQPTQNDYDYDDGDYGEYEDDDYDDQDDFYPTVSLEDAQRMLDPQVLAGIFAAGDTKTVRDIIHKDRQLAIKTVNAIRENPQWASKAKDFIKMFLGEDERNYQMASRRRRSRVWLRRLAHRIKAKLVLVDAENDLLDALRSNPTVADSIGLAKKISERTGLSLQEVAIGLDEMLKPPPPAPQFHSLETANASLQNSA